MRASRLGATLFELLLTLCVIGVLFSVSLPRMRAGMDALAVRAARENAFALFSRARVLALQQGGATIEVDATSDRIAIRTAAGVLEREQSFREHGVELVLDGADQIVTLRLDAHGVGRMMSRTLRFLSHEAQAGLTISSFGRVRRW